MRIPDPLSVDALGPHGPYRARSRQTIHDVTGAIIGELSLVPPVYIARAISDLRSTPQMRRSERFDILETASSLFADGEVAGQSAYEYQHVVSRVSGLGIREVGAATARIADAARNAYAHAQFGRPIGAVDDEYDERCERGTGFWGRKGDVFSVLAAGNHPAVHTGWLQALALGYRVAVRPSRREPFTPSRLVQALLQAGMPKGQVALLPTGYGGADEIIRLTDLAMVYGGHNVADKYSGPNVLIRGPGRAKLLISRPHEWKDLLDVMVESVVKGGGVGCTNATCILVEGDRDEALYVACALAERLRSFRPYIPEDPQSVLPVRPIAEARSLEAALRESAEAVTTILGADGIVADIGDGSAALLPAVFLLDNAGQAQSVAIEMPFPCVWIGPWNRADGIAPLRDSVHLTLITDDQDLVEASLNDPSIRSTFVGKVPTTFADPSVPHEGFVSEFLMQPKGYVRRW